MKKPVFPPNQIEKGMPTWAVNTICVVFVVLSVTVFCVALYLKLSVS